ncbi:MAG TPA: hypothetical protein VKA48_09945 [Gammaproteobacteria bacterium]|nr:hypothetical protein [Gammaproteobacteria bacterium]
MKTIVWTGPDRELPGLGLIQKDQIITLADWAADSYVRQGLAKTRRPRKAGEGTTSHPPDNGGENEQ